MVACAGARCWSGKCALRVGTASAIVRETVVNWVASKRGCLYWGITSVADTTCTCRI